MRRPSWRYFFLRTAAPRATVYSVRASFLGILMLASLASWGCGSDDPEVVRRGGGDLPDTNRAGGDGTVAAGGANSGAEVPFCDALEVVRSKCQRCHGDPLENAAPAPFLTYEDTQAQYYDTERKYSDVMLSAVDRDIMPYVSLNEGPSPIAPPVEPLTTDEKTTLLGWLKQGALPAGGTDCP